MTSRDGPTAARSTSYAAGSASTRARRTCSLRSVGSSDCAAAAADPASCVTATGAAEPEPEPVSALCADLPQPSANSATNTADFIAASIRERQTRTGYDARMRTWIPVVMGVLACGNRHDERAVKATDKPAEAPAPPREAVTFVARALGSTGATIDVPDGWVVTDRSMHDGHYAWVIENDVGDTSSTREPQMVTCISMPVAASIEDFAAHSEGACGADPVRKKETLPSGAFYVECPFTGGARNTHFDTAIAIPRTAEGDEMMHCFTRPAKPQPEEIQIVRSLRNK